MQDHHDELAVLDYAALYERTGEDAATAVEVLEDLKGAAPREMARLVSAVEAREVEAARKAAHRLKGALLVVGANRAAAVAKEIERLTTVDLEATKKELATLEAHWSATLAAVDEVVARGGAVS